MIQLIKLPCLHYVALGKIRGNVGRTNTACWKYLVAVDVILDRLYTLPILVFAGTRNDDF